jgi:hypothetical protein
MPADRLSPWQRGSTGARTASRAWHATTVVIVAGLAVLLAPRPEGLARMGEHCDVIPADAGGCDVRVCRARGRPVSVPCGPGRCPIAGPDGEQRSAAASPVRKSHSKSQRGQTSGDTQLRQATDQAGQVPSEPSPATSSDGQEVTGGQGGAGSNPAVPTRRSRSEGVPGSNSGPFWIFGSQSRSHRRATSDRIRWEQILARRRPVPVGNLRLGPLLVACWSADLSDAKVDLPG